MNRFDCKNNFSECCTFSYSDFDSVVTNFVQPNVVDPLCIDCSTDSDGKVISIAFRNDISLLFNQERLENALGKDGLKKFFDDMSSRSSSFTELRKKISDDDLASMCKSRYLQSPSEILAWSQYLNANYEHLISEVKERSVNTSSSDSAPSDSASSASAPSASAPSAASSAQ